MSNGIDNDCADCARLKDMLIDAETANAELGRQIAGLELHLRRGGRAEVALRTELAQQREEEPEAEAIKAVLNHWKLRLGHKQAKTNLSTERAKKVRARLRDKFTVADLKKAIDGCAKLPYVSAGGRKATGSKRERHDDLTIICRDETTVERFIRYADEPEEAPVATPRPPPRPSGPSGVDAILNRLEAVTQTRLGQWTARCPAHEDRHASLSLAQGSKGAVVHCHAGCTAEAIAHAAGIDVVDLFDREDPPVARPPVDAAPLPSTEQLEQFASRLAGNERLLQRVWDLRRWSAKTLNYLYVGFDGERLTLPVRNDTGELVNVLRYLPRRAGEQRKLLAAKGHPRDLFPAPESIDGDELWLVEGEPDAITGRELGLPTVAVPGVNGWRPAWASRLAGRHITICFDCDIQGRAAAERVHADLSPVADVRTLDLEPERTDGYDLSDALLDGADPHILRVMADAILNQEVAA